jgi:hypothetical protein
MDNLRYIRGTMERAGSFTAVPGLGGVLMGSTALVTAWIATSPLGVDHWMTIWTIECAIGVLVGVAAAALKARRLQVPLLRGPGRKFIAGFAPAIFAGAADHCLARCRHILVSAGDLAAALRDGCAFGRVGIGGRGSGDGRLLYGGGASGSPQAGPAAKRSAGGRIRRAAYHFWHDYRGETWRLDKIHFVKNGACPRPPP